MNLLKKVKKKKITETNSISQAKNLGRTNMLCSKLTSSVYVVAFKGNTVSRSRPSHTQKKPQ